MKKYELTEKTKVVGAVTLHRIRALRDFGNIKAGDLGGWVESERNLSHDGNAQVSGGTWEHSPLYIQGTRYPFNIASDKEVRVGCQIHTWEEWRDKYREIAEKHRAEDIVAEYIMYFNLACKLYGHEDCMIPEVEKGDGEG